MDFRELGEIITLVMFLQISASEPHGGDKWPSRPATFPQNNQQNILLGIEQRLRVLDSIRHAVSRNEISLEALSNRIELMETRLAGFQNTMQHKFDSIITAVSSAEMKYELFIDQASRKLQTDLERINHKLSTAEARLDTTVNKIQNQMELNFQNLGTKQVNIANELSKVQSGIDMLKTESTNTDLRHNRTLGILVNHLQEIRHEHTDKKEHLKNLTSLVIGLQPKKSEGWTQSDAPMLPNQQIQIIKAEIGTEAHKIGSKMSNMYNEMWKSIRDLEIIIKMALNENNNKTKELHKDLHQILLEEKRETESFIDVIIQSAMADVLTKMVDVHTKLSDLQTDLHILIESNGLQGDSCHEIKSILEKKVAFILTRIYETFINRTDKFSKQVEDMEVLLKSESKQLSTALAKTNHYIITLAHENSHDHEQLDSSISDVAEISQDTQTQTREINETLLKYQKVLKELKGIFYHEYEIKGSKSFSLSNETTTNNPISVLEANYSNGIIKILTDRGNIKELTDKEDSKNSRSIEMSLSKLNKSVTISDLAAVIGESKNVKNEGTKTTLSTTSEEKERDRDDEDDFDSQEEFGEEDIKPVDTNQLMLSYIKYLKGHLSPQEFLEEAVPGSKYENLQHMAQQLKRTGIVPKEMIKNIEQMMEEQTDTEPTRDHDKEIGNIIKTLGHHNKYDEALTDDNNYDEVYESPQRK